MQINFRIEVQFSTAGNTKFGPTKSRGSDLFLWTGPRPAPSPTLPSSCCPRVIGVLRGITPKRWAARVGISQARCWGFPLGSSHI